MLDVMRSHASSWLIKVVFGLIILSFILFFGYRSMTGGGGAGVAAVVNGEEVPVGAYRMAYDDVMAFYKNLYKDNIPDEMEDQLRQTALFKVINQALLSQLGGKLGLTVIDSELYKIISGNPSFQDSGVFQEEYYTQEFLPMFKARFGMDYEEFLRNQLLTMKTVDFLTSHVTVSELEAKGQYMEDNTLWSFERIKVLLEAPDGVNYGIPAGEIAKSVIEAAKKDVKKDLDQVIKKYRLDREELDSIGISDRHRLVPSQQENEVLSGIFRLSKDQPVYNTPVNSGSALYVFVLKEVEMPSPEDWEKEKAEFLSVMTERARQEYLMEWQEYMRRHARIEQFVLQGN